MSLKDQIQKFNKELYDLNLLSSKTVRSKYNSDYSQLQLVYEPHNYYLHQACEANDYDLIDEILDQKFEINNSSIWALLSICKYNEKNFNLLKKAINKISLPYVLQPRLFIKIYDYNLEAPLIKHDCFNFFVNGLIEKIKINPDDFIFCTYITDEIALKNVLTNITDLSNKKILYILANSKIPNIINIMSKKELNGKDIMFFAVENKNNKLLQYFIQSKTFPLQQSELAYLFTKINSQETINLLCQNLSIEEVKQLNLDLLINYVKNSYRPEAINSLKNIMESLSLVNFSFTMTFYQWFLTDDYFTNYEDNINKMILNIIWKHLLKNKDLPDVAEFMRKIANTKKDNTKTAIAKTKENMYRFVNPDIKKEVVKILDDYNLVLNLVTREKDLDNTRGKAGVLSYLSKYKDKKAQYLLMTRKL